MKTILSNASNEQLEKLWTACYDTLRILYEIKGAKDIHKRMSLRLKIDLVSELELLLMRIIQEERRRM